MRAKGHAAATERSRSPVAERQRACEQTRALIAHTRHRSAVANALLRNSQLVQVPRSQFIMANLSPHNADREPDCAVLLI